jgi:hypothetical protein
MCFRHTFPGGRDRLWPAGASDHLDTARIYADDHYAKITPTMPPAVCILTASIGASRVPSR